MFEIAEGKVTQDEEKMGLLGAILLVQQLEPEYHSQEASVMVSVVCVSSEVISMDISFTKKYLVR